MFSILAVSCDARAVGHKHTQNVLVQKPDLNLVSVKKRVF